MNYKSAVLGTRDVSGSRKSTYRIKVPDGWLVRDDYRTIQHRANERVEHINMSMAFVPDKEHVWKIDIQKESK